MYAKYCWNGETRLLDSECFVVQKITIDEYVSKWPSASINGSIDILNRVSGEICIEKWVASNLNN